LESSTSTLFDWGDQPSESHTPESLFDMREIRRSVESPSSCEEYRTPWTRTIQPTLDRGKDRFQAVFGQFPIHGL